MIFTLFTISLLVAISIYLILQANPLKRLFGIISFSTVINMLILVCGRLHSTQPAFIDKEHSAYVNPVPQALILTAIVIGFGLMAYLCALIKKVYDQ